MIWGGLCSTMTFKGKTKRINQKFAQKINNKEKKTRITTSVKAKLTKFRRMKVNNYRNTEFLLNTF